jgi:hypothetical protein
VRGVIRPFTSAVVKGSVRKWIGYAESGNWWGYVQSFIGVGIIEFGCQLIGLVATAASLLLLLLLLPPGAVNIETEPFDAARCLLVE